MVPATLKCLTVVVNGEPGAALPEGVTTVPLVQVTLTGTGVSGPDGEYTLFTVKVVLVSVLVTVQLAGTALVIATEPQVLPVWM